MRFIGTPIPAIPVDTLRAAQIMFGKGNLYLKIGDRLETLFSQEHLATLDAFPHKKAVYPWQLVLVTIFQFIEELTDRQIAEAVYKRLDLKYALHLPLNYPGFEIGLLCEFRQWLLSEPTARQHLQVFLDGMTSTGMVTCPGKTRRDVNCLLLEVCTLSRLEKMLEMMSQALEALALNHSDWLREIVQPHWYQRYARAGAAGRLPRSHSEQQSLAMAIGQDASHLLAMTREMMPTDQLQPAWLIGLRQLVNDQYDQSPGEVRWRALCRVGICHLGDFPDEISTGDFPITVC